MPQFLWSSNLKHCIQKRNINQHWETLLLVESIMRKYQLIHGITLYHLMERCFNLLISTISYAMVSFDEEVIKSIYFKL
jgi:hypothetical protein